MIRPDMATMLAFVATDAAVDPALLREILHEAVADSFNAITVDGDTSTNDACRCWPPVDPGRTFPATGGDRARFATAVSEVCVDLAQAIVRDGEGATKFITVRVEGGRDVAECRQVAYTIAHSPLVKTAFFASDPNWGRILAAVGRSGLDALDLERVTIHLDEVCIVRDGGRAPDYTEEQGQRVMARPEIAIRVELGRGGAARESGPPICPSTMCASTPSTGRERPRRAQLRACGGGHCRRSRWGGADHPPARPRPSRWIVGVSGGKVEHGESVIAALGRELREVGIAVRAAEPLLQTGHAYPDDRRVLLDVWRVTDFEGEPHGREGQPLVWASPGEMEQYTFPAADAPIIAALLGELGKTD